MSSRGADSAHPPRTGVVAWALWDCGATGVNAVVVTFVFSVYLTQHVGSGLPGPSTPASWLGRALTIAGVCVALLAPATGMWVNAPHRRRTALAVLTGLVVAMTSAMSLIRRRLPLPVGRVWCCLRARRRAATWRPCRTTPC